MIELPKLLLVAAGGGMLAALTTNLLVPFVRRTALALRAVDYPGGRKQQAGAVPRLGGVAIAIGLAIGVGAMAVVLWGRLSVDVTEKRQLLALAVGTAVIFMLGVVDDLIEVGSGRKFVLQFLAAGLLVGNGWSFEVVTFLGVTELDLGLAGPLVSLLFLVGVTNAINLIDGLDGLASGVVGIIALSLLLFALLQDQVITAVLMSATAGACAGFLRHNWAPAKIFMGDSGSLTLGFLLAAASVGSAVKTPTVVAILVPLLALGLPVMDTLLVMALRFARRRRGSLVQRVAHMFEADRSHIHHLMSNLIASRHRIVVLLYALALLFCLGGVWVALVRDPKIGLVLVALEFLVVLLIRWRGMAAEARRIAQQKKADARRELQENGSMALE